MTWLARCCLFLVLLAFGWTVGRAIGRHHVQRWTPGHTRVRVLTTIFPIYDFAREVGGPLVEVRNLLPPGVDPHEFALSPRDIDLVANADLILMNGSGLDDFVVAALKDGGITHAEIIRLSDGLPKLQSAEHDHGETGDPHLWLDPVDAKAYVGRIGDALASTRARVIPGAEGPGGSNRTRVRKYESALASLDSDYRTMLAPLKGRSFVAFHGAYQYLAKRYSLNVAAVWEQMPGREPSPKEVTAIMKMARANRIRAFFAEPQFSSRAIEMIAADAHLPVYTLDPVETAIDFEHTHYIGVMRENLATLVRALGGSTDP